MFHSGPPSGPAVQRQPPAVDCKTPAVNRQLPAVNGQVVVLQVLTVGEFICSLFTKDDVPRDDLTLSCVEVLIASGRCAHLLGQGCINNFFFVLKAPLTQNIDGMCVADLPLASGRKTVFQ